MSSFVQRLRHALRMYMNATYAETRGIPCLARNDMDLDDVETVVPSMGQPKRSVPSTDSRRCFTAHCMSSTHLWKEMEDALKHLTNLRPAAVAPALPRRESSLPEDLVRLLQRRKLDGVPPSHNSLASIPEAQLVTTYTRTSAMCRAKKDVRDKLNCISRRKIHELLRRSQHQRRVNRFLIQVIEEICSSQLGGKSRKKSVQSVQLVHLRDDLLDSQQHCPTLQALNSRIRGRS